MHFSRQAEEESTSSDFLLPDRFVEVIKEARPWRYAGMCYSPPVFASFSPVLPSIMDRVALRTQIKELIIRELNLEGKTPAELDDDAPLFGSGLGLDSLDALQLAMAIEERYQVTLPEGDEVRPIFASVASLADFVAGSKPVAIVNG